MATDLFTLRTYWNPLEAHMARNQLEAEGVHAFVTEEGTGALFGNQLGAVKLMVENKDAPRAVEILGLVETENEVGSEEAPADWWMAGVEEGESEKYTSDEDRPGNLPVQQGEDVEDEESEDEEKVSMPMESMRRAKWLLWLVLWPYILGAVLLVVGLLWLLLSMLR